MHWDLQLHTFTSLDIKKPQNVIRKTFQYYEDIYSKTEITIKTIPLVSSCVFN